MSFGKSQTAGGLDDNKMNDHFSDLLNSSIGSMDSKGEDVKNISHDAPPNSGKTPDGPMGGELMSWTQMLEAMDEVNDSLVQQSPENDIANAPVPMTEPETNDVDDKDLLDELNRLFTPVLVMQGFERDISDKANAELSEAAVLTERNVISFDEPSRMAQLLSVCALLRARKKNTPNWQLFKKAAAIKTQAKLNIQQEEYDEARALAQKYLVMVSTTNNSSVARDAANDLLPETQH